MAAPPDAMLTEVPSSLKQRAWEVMALSLAVILGFNIGDGNIRDKLETGEMIVRLFAECPVLCVLSSVSAGLSFITILMDRLQTSQVYITLSRHNNVISSPS